MHQLILMAVKVGEMIKTAIPGEGDDFSSEAEIEAIERMLQTFDLEQKRARAANSIGFRAMKADVFGYGVLEASQMPDFRHPSIHSIYSNN
jgi:hypothetical protein